MTKENPLIQRFRERFDGWMLRYRIDHHVRDEIESFLSEELSARDARVVEIVKETLKDLRERPKILEGKAETDKVIDVALIVAEANLLTALKE